MSAISSPWTTYAMSQSGASEDVQDAVVAGTATLLGGAAAGLLGQNASAGALAAQNEALNNALQHKEKVKEAIQKVLSRNHTLAAKYSTDTLMKAAENVYGAGGGPDGMNIWTNEADAKAATALRGTTYYRDGQGHYIERWDVPVGAEEVARNIVDNAGYEYGPSFYAVSKDNFSQLTTEWAKTFGADPSQFQGVGEAAAAGLGALGTVVKRDGSSFTDYYLSGSGGRWGSAATRQLNYDVAQQLVRSGYTL